jgi:F-type H+-transporting ATPase subunit b
MHYLLLASSLTEIRPGLIFWTLVTFIFVLIVLRATAWKPILDLVDERERQIQNAIDSAKKERAEAEKLLSEQKLAIAEARREAAEMMRKNQTEVERFREELMTKARAEAEAQKKDAERAIEEQKQKALAEIRSQAVDLAMLAAEKLLGKELDDQKHRMLAEQFIEQLPKQATERGARP